MASRGETPPAVKARVVLQPLKSQKLEGRSPEQKNKKRTVEKEREKDTKQEQPSPAADESSSVPDFCLDLNKKVNKEQTASIMRYFKDMRGIVEELLPHNSYLTGKLEQSTGSGNKETVILSAVNKSLQTSKRLETAVKKTARMEPKQPSYAEKVKMKSSKVGQIAVKSPRNIVIIHPESKESEIKSCEEAREAVFTLVNLRKKGIQVTAVRKINENGLVVETAKPESLMAFTENAKLKEAGLKASMPQRRLPRVILYDVPREIPEKELLVCIRKQNQDRLTDEDVVTIRFCFRTGRKDSQETNWVLEVPPR